MRRISLSRSLSLTLAALAAQAGLTACGSGSGTPTPSGATDFVSAPFAGQGGGATDNGAAAGTSAAAPAAPATSGAGKSSKPTTRTVQETDLYRLDGNRLYYLNSYRGLMVFDVTNVDQPKLLGRSPIFGTPVDMIVSQGIATVVVGDWYGTLDDGSPFHGSIVRGLDATDPTHIKVLGDAKLGGWVQEDRVVGNVLYAVSEDYGWNYGWGIGIAAAGRRRWRRRGRVGRGERPERHRLVSELRWRPGQAGGLEDVRRLRRRVQRDAELDPPRASGHARR